MNTKERIMDCALTLFSKSGYDAVSVEQIALEVGIKAPSLDKHFKNKQAIFDGIMLNMQMKYDEQMHSMNMHLYESEKDTSVFNKISTEDLVQKVHDLISYSIHDKTISNFRKFLTIEQFRNKEFAALYTQRYYSNLMNYLGLLGLISFISYLSAVVFSPLAYPGYNWMAQTVSDLSATNAPSLTLWNQLNSLTGPCGIVSIMMVCIFIQGKLTKPLRFGIYLFAIMNWFSIVGYEMFPLTQAGYAGTFQDIMHVVVTIVVVILSITSLITIMISGYTKYKSLSICAFIALSLMLVDAIGMNIVPINYFGIVERFRVLAATAFNAILGLYLFNPFQFKNHKEL